MAELVVETPEGVTLRYELAGAGSRSAAALFDGLIWGAVMLAAFIVLFSLGGAGGLILWVVTGVLVSLSLYQIVFAVLMDGRTPGKWLLGIRVVDEHGFPAGVGQHVLRGLFWPLEAVIILVPLPLGVILIAATPRRQRLGDLVAGTTVVRDLSRRAPAEPFRRETWSSFPRKKLELVPAHAARFDGEDLAFLRELLGRVGMSPGSRRRLLTASARHYAAQLDLASAAKLSPTESRELLHELYLFLREMRTGRD